MMRRDPKLRQPLATRATQARGRPGALIGLALALDLSLTAFAAPADARTYCRKAMFQCIDGQSFTGMNLRKAISSKRRARWALKHCHLVPASDEPYRCDWRATIRRRRPAAGPRPATPAPTPGHAPRQPAGHAPPGAQPTPAAPARPAVKQPRRDVRGRYSTTPAPARLPRISAKDRAPYAAEVAAAAARYKLPPNLIRAVMKVESGYNPTVVSHAGAVGLMQLLPETGKAMGVQDLRDPAQNILGGARFIRILANRFRGDLVKVLSAYHAGSTRVKRRGGTPYAATDSYVRKVLGVYYALRGD